MTTQDMLNLYNQLSWRVKVNNKIVDAEKGSWITQEKYSESIRDVMGKAIVDCITGKNEFENKTPDDVIMFDVDATTYNNKNWNAVILWNLVHVYNCKYVSTGPSCIEDALKEVATRVKDKYSPIDNIEEKVGKAVHDIEEYIKALDLQKELTIFCQHGKELRDKGCTKLGIAGLSRYHSSLVPYMSIGGEYACAQEKNPTLSEAKWKYVSAEPQHYHPNPCDSIKFRYNDRLYSIIHYGISTGIADNGIAFCKIKLNTAQNPYIDRMPGALCSNEDYDFLEDKIRIGIAKQVPKIFGTRRSISGDLNYEGIGEISYSFNVSDLVS